YPIPAPFLTLPPTTEIHTLSLHDALPISHRYRREEAHRDQLPAVRHGEPRGLHAPHRAHLRQVALLRDLLRQRARAEGQPRRRRSEEHTSELQSRENLVCRLLLEKKNK